MVARLALTSLLAFAAFMVGARARTFTGMSGVPAVFFIGGAWAGLALGRGLLAAIGFGVAVMTSGTSAFWIFIGTQAWSPEYPFFATLMAAARMMVIAAAGGAFIGLAPLIAGGARAWWLGVLGFAAGAIGGAFLLFTFLLAATSRSTSSVLPPSVWSLLSTAVFLLTPILPAVLGGWVAGRTLDDRSPSRERA